MNWIPVAVRVVPGPFRLGLWLVPAVLLAVSGCDATDPAAATDDGGTLLAERGDALAGARAFVAECGSCHASRNGFDLAFFSFTDTTIIRRALAHVEFDVALDIVAHIRQIQVPGLPETAPVFQPGDRVLQNDRAFALELFGADEWPDDLTSSELRAIDPVETPVAVRFPIWSMERSNLDWMPDRAVPDHLLDYRNGRARDAIAAYYRQPSAYTLRLAVDALSDGDKDVNNPDAPCVMDPIERLRPTECFEVRRWAASLGAQHMLRTGETDPIHFDVHDVWWDVGNVARRTVVNRAVEGEIANGVENWISWMWIGWAFEPHSRASVYLSLGLERRGLLRHATFHILRAQVERRPNTSTPYRDLRNVPRFAPEHWLKDAMVFGARHLIERLESGELPTGDGLTLAIEETERAFRDASRKLGDSDAAALNEYRDRILALLR